MALSSFYGQQAGTTQHVTGFDHTGQPAALLWIPLQARVYTDASWSSNHCTSGIAVFHHNVVELYGTNLQAKDNNDAELYSAMNGAVLGFHHAAHVALFSDSLVALKKVDQAINNCNSMRDLHMNPVEQTLNQIIHLGGTLRMQHVRAHGVNYGNLLADVIAREAIKGDFHLTLTPQQLENWMREKQVEFYRSTRDARVRNIINNW